MVLISLILYIIINIQELLRIGIIFDFTFVIGIYLVFNEYLKIKTDNYLKSFMKDVKIQELNGILSSVSHE